MLLALLIESLLSGLTVTVPAEAQVTGTGIELGELCTVTGLDAERIARVRALDLGYAPAPGFSRLLTLERIRAEVARALPEVPLRILGERTCRVRPAVEELDPTVLEQVARRELQRSFEGVDATFTLLEPLSAVRVPRGDRESSVQARVPALDKASGQFGVPIEVLVDGLRYRTIWTSWRVDVWETRPATTAPVPSERFARALAEPRAPAADRPHWSRRIFAW